MKELIENIKGTAFVLLVVEMCHAQLWCWQWVPVMIGCFA